MQIVKGLRQLLLPGYYSSLYTNLDGCQASDNPTATIPPELLVTTARPDIAIFNGSIMSSYWNWKYTTQLEPVVHWGPQEEKEKIIYCYLLEDLGNIGVNCTLITQRLGHLATGHPVSVVYQTLEHCWMKQGKLPSSCHTKSSWPDMRGTGLSIELF